MRAARTGGPGSPVLEVDAAWFACSYTIQLTTGTIETTIDPWYASFNTFVPKAGTCNGIEAGGMSSAT